MSDERQTLKVSPALHAERLRIASACVWFSCEDPEVLWKYINSSINLVEGGASCYTISYRQAERFSNACRNLFTDSCGPVKDQGITLMNIAGIHARDTMVRAAAWSALPNVYPFVTIPPLKPAVCHVWREILGDATAVRQRPRVTSALVARNATDVAWAAEEHARLTGVHDPAQLCVLADALEEAGCVDPEILRHLRGFRVCPGHWILSGPKLCSTCGTASFDPHADVPLPTDHYHGCWAVDAVRGEW